MNPLVIGFTRLLEKHRSGTLAYWAFDRLSTALSRLGLAIQITMIYRESEGEGAKPQPRLADVVCGVSTAAELSELAGIRSDTSSYEEFVERVRQGAQCYYMRHEDRIIGYTWCEIHGSPRPRFGLAFGPTDAYVYDAYTIPAYRGLNLLPFLRYHVLQDLKRRGCDVVLSSTDIFNRPAHRFKQKLGAQPIVIRLYVKLFGWFERVFTLYQFRALPLSVQAALEIATTSSS